MKMDKLNNPSAFPERKFLDSGTQDSDRSGMTLLDYFAAKAMQAWFTDDMDFSSQNIQNCVEASYKVAHAMLLERQKHL